MSAVENFLTKQEEEEIIAAIKNAEKNTSGEIRVHLETTSVTPHFKRAKEVFSKLQMYNTKEKNGVLLYIAVQDKKFVIIGDKGINELVSEDFWNSTKKIIQEYFKQKKFKTGIIKGINEVGNKLKKYFPYKNDDKNELPDEISKG